MHHTVSVHQVFVSGVIIAMNAIQGSVPVLSLAPHNPYK